MADSGHAPFALREWRVGFGSTSLLASIVAGSAVLAFAGVRAWFVPVRATALVPATLTVDTQPPGAELRIDGQPRGTTPLTFSIAAGAHTLAVHAGASQREVRLTLAA